VTVATAGPYASLYLTPDRKPRQHPTTQFLQAGCPSCRPTNCVKALDGEGKFIKKENNIVIKEICSWLPHFSANRISSYSSNQGGSQEHISPVASPRSTLRPNAGWHSNNRLWNNWFVSIEHRFGKNSNFTTLIPATSIPSERLFSKAWDVIIKKRN